MNKGGKWFPLVIIATILYLSLNPTAFERIKRIGKLVAAEYRGQKKEPRINTIVQKQETTFPENDNALKKNEIEELMEKIKKDIVAKAEELASQATEENMMHPQKYMVRENKHNVWSASEVASIMSDLNKTDSNLLETLNK